MSTEVFTFVDRRINNDFPDVYLSYFMIFIIHE